jgi:hypothetical protein
MLVSPICVNARENATVFRSVRYTFVSTSASQLAPPPLSKKAVPGLNWGASMSN